MGENSLIIGFNKSNSLAESFMYYYKYDCKSIKIDAQITQDKKIALCNSNAADMRLKHLFREKILTLDEYFKYIPQDMTTIIDMTRQYGGKQNLIANDVVCRMIMAAKRHGKKNIIYISYDRELTRIVIKNRREAWLMIKDESELVDLDIYPTLVIDKDLIETVAILFPMKTIILNHLKNHEEWLDMKSKYPFIKGGIISIYR